ncbi:MAG: hypothetical protein JNL21_26855 [Myxococcales bacterium]|nr:hypothetical protein [Myxococcales bacterium]
MRRPDVLVVHVTTGAPRDRGLWPSDAPEGLGAYAGLRRREAEQAPSIAGLEPERILTLGLVRFRIAPVYDYARPPLRGVLHYESLGWPMRGLQWCELAVAAARELSLPPFPFVTPALPDRGDMPLTVLNVAFPFAPVGPDSVGGAEQIVSALDAALLRAGHRSIDLACDGSTAAGDGEPYKYLWGARDLEHVCAAGLRTGPPPG